MTNNMVDLQIVVQCTCCTAYVCIIFLTQASHHCLRRLGSINKMSVNIKNIKLLMNEKKLIFFLVFADTKTKINNQPFHQLSSILFFSVCSYIWFTAMKKKPSVIQMKQLSNCLRPKQLCMRENQLNMYESVCVCVFFCWVLCGHRG